MSSIICIVDAITKPKDITINQPINGSLLLRQFSDVNIVLQFSTKDNNNKFISDYCVDIDNINIINESNTFIFMKDITTIIKSYISNNINNNMMNNDKEFLIVNVIDNDDFNTLKDAIYECKTICEYSLRLQTISRDIFYAGVCLQNDSKNILNNDNLPKILLETADIASKSGIYLNNNNNKNKIKSNNPNIIDNNTIINNPFIHALNKLENIGSGVKLNNKTNEHYHQQQKQQQHKVKAHLSCVFCDTIANDSSSLFVLHPYVPKSFDNEAIYLCSNCIENWKNHREQAEKNNLLILENEVNEELCAICADTPSELVMCSNCPRSYCNACLIRVIKTIQLQELKNDNDSDWTCMCCRNNISKIPLISRSNWKYYKISHGILTNVKKNIEQQISSSNNNYNNNNNDNNNNISNDECNILLALPCNKDIGIKRKQQSLNNNISNNLSMVVKKGKPRQKTIDLPPVNQEQDEVYYFSQYIQVYEELSCNISTNWNNVSTDDVCFLCKDGGDLIECDYKKCSKKKKCRKVYHQYCLSYNVGDDKIWNCPRHFCDMCGSTKLKYICKYCPVSICENCPENMVKKYGLSKYLLVDKLESNEFNADIDTIVCQTCLDMYNRVLERSNYNTHILTGIEKLFPGIFDKESKISRNKIFHK
jgi:hypothetical protein